MKPIHIALLVLAVTVAACFGYMAGDREHIVQLYIPEPTTTTSTTAP